MTDATRAGLPATVAVLGGGSMGGAIAGGLARIGVPDVRVTTRSAATGAQRSAPGLTVRSLEADPGATRAAVDGAEVVVLAVKPAGVVPLAAEVAHALGDGAVVVSVAAGIRTAAIEAVLPGGTAVLRAMPNTPAAIGEGVTGLADGSAVTGAARAAARAVFQSVGAVVEVPESRIDALSAVSGSGPAYVFRFVESMLAASRELGFGEEDARAMVLGTVAGAVDLLVTSGEEPAELRRRVTSPGGTTERAVAVLDAGLDDLLLTGMRAAIARAGEIAAG